MSKIRVLIVDDHAMLRSGLRLLIDAQADMTVVGEAGDVRQAVDEAATTPDVITLDLSMPGGSGVSGVERFRGAAPAAKVLVLTMHDDPAYVRSAIALGAAGYVVKSAADSELISAIRAVSRGRIFVDTKDSGNLATALNDPRAHVADHPPIEDLSDREREVLVDVARGHTSQEVADRLGLSVKTVESYRARMMQKLGLKTRADLVRVAVDSGLLNDRPS